jgi:leucyl-tRNA synthetase
MQRLLHSSDGRLRPPFSTRKIDNEHWMLAITKYADRLDKDLDETEFLEKIKIQQRNWIGKSEGAEIEFEIKGTDKKIKVFTTRPDTIFGVTYVVLSPEHEYVKELALSTQNVADIEAYVKEVKVKTDIERTDATSAKTGVELKGIVAINPATKSEIPIWIADYVLADYGTGAVMAVPAHDERDGAFAKKYKLPVKQVIEPLYIKKEGVDAVKEEKPFVEREATICIVKHWSEDKYLCSKWKTNDWKGFVIGGIEPGEDEGVAAVRELGEETGYIDAKYIKTLGKFHSKFWHDIKQVNRFAHFKVVYIELHSNARQVVAEEEKKLHDIEWVSRKGVRDFINRPDLKYSWDLHAFPETSYTGDGLLINSGQFDGKNSEEIKKEITESVGGTWVTKFKLRDWIFSRQRYWGEPIPVVHCEKCGIVPLPEKELPLTLPKVKNYQPTETGESPLASITKWVNTKCPTCKGPAKRETDTMPNWAGSSWYYLRYIDPKNSKAFADPKKINYWTPVDWYNGGMEHTTLHLLYSRFWHKFLFDLGLVPTSEPYKKRTSHGLILAAGGEKMSKSKGNVINPDSIVKTVGADALRVYEMFMGPFDQHIAWDTNNIAGSRRFIERVWKLSEKVGTPTAESVQKIDAVMHRTIKKVSDDIEEMKFNTAVSAMMIAVNDLEKEKEISAEAYKILVKLFSPFAPHAAEELWARLREKKSVHVAPWPIFDPAKVVESTVKVVVQINGKVRAEFETASGTTDEELKKLALERPETMKWIEGKEIKKIIVVKGKLVNIVV